MATDDVRKVAFCSAIVAGFAYMGYSLIQKVFCRRRRRSHRNEKSGDNDGFQSTRSSQTDLTLPCSMNFSTLPQEGWVFSNPSRSVKDKVKELDLRARQFGESCVVFAPNLKPRSLQNSPWSSPRILSPIDGAPSAMSRSAENISFATPPGSPHLRRKSSILRTVLNHDHLAADNEDTIDCHPVVSGREPEEIMRKRLNSLYAKARPMTPYEAKSIASLLSSEDEDLLVQTLTTISNCAAFTVNQEHLCDAGCLPLLKEYLDYPSVAVQVAATQAIANLSANEHNQGLLQTCIERLVERSTSRQCGELLRIASLTALANLALFNANHMTMKGGISGFLLLLDEGSSAVRLQSLKLLVNLSCNPNMLPSILASKASTQLYKYLSLKGDYDVSLRLISFLANVMTEASKQKFKARDLPGEQKAPYPETLYAALYGHNGKDLLRKKLASLSSSKDEDIIAQIRRLRESLHTTV